MKSEIMEALNKFDEQMKAIGGCTDGHCCVKPPLGMKTNGGCHCMSDKHKARRVAFAAKELRGAILNILDFPQEDATLAQPEAVAWLITWNSGDKKISFDKCHPDDGSCVPLFTHPADAPVREFAGVKGDGRGKPLEMIERLRDDLEQKGHTEFADRLREISAEIATNPPPPLRRMSRE